MTAEVTKIETSYIYGDWLAGVVAAAEWAHDNYEDTEKDDIIDAVIAAHVRKEAGVDA